MKILKIKKRLLLFNFIFVCSFGYAQEKNGYLYKIKLQGVDNFGTAKEIEFVLEQKFNNFASFNDTTDCFEFYSPLQIQEADFNTLITSKGYILLLYTSLACTNCEIVEQE